MKKQILSFFLTILFLLPFLVSAQIWIDPPLTYKTIAELIEALTNLIFWVALSLVPVLILIGTFFIMTSTGEPAKIKKGRDFILYAVIGSAVVLFARGILAIIKYILGG